MKLALYNPGDPGASVESDALPPSKKAKMIRQNDRYRRSKDELMTNLGISPSALEDIRSKILDLPWSQAGVNEGRRMTIMDGLPLSLRGIRPGNWFSFSGGVEYYTYYWATPCDLSETSYPPRLMGIPLKLMEIYKGFRFYFSNFEHFEVSSLQY